MKLKIRFPGFPLPIRKHVTRANLFGQQPEDKRQAKYIAAILILWLIIFIFGISRCNAAQFKPLKVGDKVPDLAFTNLVNYGSKTLKFSDFKGKVVVLDFWATWCSSCLAKFPGERQLQNMLPDQLEILLVNPKSSRDSHDRVVRFFEERKHLYNFPSIVEDTLLIKLFPNNGLPHYVWIKDNVVIAIPEPEDLTEANVLAVYNDQKTAMTSVTPLFHDFRQELFSTKSDGTATKIIYHSYLAAYKPELTASLEMATDSIGEYNRIDVVNEPRMGLIELCAPFGAEPTRILLKVSKPELFTSKIISSDWKRQNLFVYESTFTPRSRDEAISLMRNDIQQYFNVKIDSVTRDTDCLVVSLGDKSKIIHGQKGIHGTTNVLDHLSTPVFFHDMSMYSIVLHLEEANKIPILDETGYRERVRIELPSDLTDIKRVSESLLKQGFVVTRAKRKIKYLLVSDAVLSGKN